MSKKPMSPLGIANLMADAAQKKSQMKSKASAPDMDGDDDQSAPMGKKKPAPKQEAAIKAKNKASMK